MLSLGAARSQAEIRDYAQSYALEESKGQPEGRPLKTESHSPDADLVRSFILSSEQGLSPTKRSRKAASRNANAAHLYSSHV